MVRIVLHQPDSMSEFRNAVRSLIAANAAPETVTWQTGETGDLFQQTAPAPSAVPISIPAAFAPLAEDVICHRDPETDPLVHRLRQMQKSVKRDQHKMTAFLRFRRVEDEAGELYVAWFEPEHHILRHASSFFVDRFASMRWTILTPDGSMHWNGEALRFGPAVSKSEAPRSDDIESWWQSYYRSTFNPARVNPDLMRAHMPKKYWRNMPEAALIPGLVADAGKRTQAMIDAEPPDPRLTRPWVSERGPATAEGTLAALKAEAMACQRCLLWKPATQTVFGEGPADAAVVFVGEQPGDQEDLAGKPFVGPAGQLFDRALADAGIERSLVYVTNAVKHFKYEPRGKRRLHKTPSNAEVEHCRWWVNRELDLIKPQLVVAMGATAARSLTGRQVAITRERGRLATVGGDRRILITVHPSYLLRLPDEAAKVSEFERLVADLRIVAEELPTVRKAA
jgi:uracil-DNA glycosylase